MGRMCFASLRLPPGHGTRGFDIAVSFTLALAALGYIHGFTARTFDFYMRFSADDRQQLFAVCATQLRFHVNHLVIW
tara:strand:+ start:604 stop:834 length:231 start_codon:yes stop_codon:yes gene_type:complete